MEEKRGNKPSTTNQLFSEETQRRIEQAKREFPPGTRLPDLPAAQIIGGILNDLEREQKRGEARIITAAQKSGNSGKVVPIFNPPAKKRAA